MIQRKEIEKVLKPTTDESESIQIYKTKRQEKFVPENKVSEVQHSIVKFKIETHRGRQVWKPILPPVKQKGKYRHSVFFFQICPLKLAFSSVKISFNEFHFMSFMQPKTTFKLFNNLPQFFIDDSEGLTAMAAV